MDFFRSILTEDDPESISNNQQSDTQEEEEYYDDDDTNSNVNSSEDGSTTTTAGGGLWSFGDIVNTLTSKSESVFETYRRDLKEFGSGLRKESDLFREVASRAVKELPDVGTSVIKTTSEIISQGKEALLISSDDDSDRYRYRDRYNYKNNEKNNINRYSRFDVQLSMIRSDERTYLDEPEDIEEYKKWKLGFVVGEMRDEIERLVSDKGGVGGVYERVVPDKVDDGTFWFRYFYKVYNLRMQEDVRARLVKRSLSVDDEEELSWDVDDDDEVDEEGEQSSQAKLSTSRGEDLQSVGKTESRDDKLKSESLKNVGEGNEVNSNVEGLNVSGGNVTSAEKGEQVSNMDEKVDNKVDDSKVVVKSDRSFFQEDEDLEWDEIEDLGDNDDKKVSHGETTDKVELRKRLSTAADDEDLSWDIEDDDGEPENAGTK
uniref:protein DOS2-like n=1 Tax=Erigeron canadensis TaxID=72917 RepID=UPI001CB91A1D|nr:protein DOS2-like [Erigeron canadensis]